MGDDLKNTKPLTKKKPAKKKTKKKAKKKATKKTTVKKKRGRKKNETAKAKALRMQRQETALSYRIAGLSYSKMATQMSLSKSNCHVLVTNALKESAARIETNSDNLRDLELARIDKMLVSAYSEAAKGSTAHLREMRGFMEMRCKLLGIEAPAVQEGENLTDDNSGHDGNIIIHKHYH